MRLRALIDGQGSPRMDQPRPATVTIVATREGRPPQNRPTVAEVATVAALPEPERWADIMRGLTVEGVRLDQAADAPGNPHGLRRDRAVLILGWDARELIGLHHAKPHDHPARAGLVYSMRPGDGVASVHDAGCAIVLAGGSVPHLWRRAPLSDSICLPWELTEPRRG